MKRLLLAALALAAVAVLAPAALLAKGASEARIEGPGLDGPLALQGSGEPESGGQLALIAESAGFFAAVFGQTPDPTLVEQPAGALGPRYTITYVMPGPNNEVDELTQDLYPYAKPDAVTFTPPGQRFWTTERTRGGWFAAGSGLRELLVDAGLPASDPTAVGDDDGVPWTLLAVLAAAAGALAAGAVAAIRIRRRPDAAPAR